MIHPQELNQTKKEKRRYLLVPKGEFTLCYQESSPSNAELYKNEKWWTFQTYVYFVDGKVRYHRYFNVAPGVKPCTEPLWQEVLRGKSSIVDLKVS